MTNKAGAGSLLILLLATAFSVSCSDGDEEQSVTPTATNTMGSEDTLSVFVTFYGVADNDPPGSRAIAYQNSYFPAALHNEAGGIGTFEDPITMAAKEGRWAIGTVMYVPYLRKYVVLEDTCASCQDQQIDVWMESDDARPVQLDSCQRQWTRQAKVEISPEAGKEVDLTPFYDTQTGNCRTPTN